MTVEVLQDYIQSFCKIAEWKEDSVKWGITFIRIDKLKTLIAGLKIVGVTVRIFRAIFRDYGKTPINCEFNIYSWPEGCFLDIYVRPDSVYWDDP